MKVPQFMPWVGKEEYEAISSCFEQNWITEGPKAKEFLAEFLKITKAKYGVLAPNGTLALYLALKAIGIKEGDEVLVPDFTFIASATSVEMAGGKPVFVDVNRRNFQIDLSGAERLITTKTKAVMPVHIYGTVVQMDAVSAFAKKHKLKIIEDAAQAVGVHYRGQHAGTFGEVGAFSFFADKTVTTAEGGCVVTNDEKIYENLLYLRNVGRIDRGSFIHPRIGYNLRMTDIQCAVGLVQLKKLSQIIERKQKIATIYRSLLKSVEAVKFFEPDPGCEWIPFRMGILCPEATALMEFMKKNEIEPRSFFYPMHRQPAFEYLKHDKSLPNKLEDKNFPNAVYGYERGICLPTFPSLSEEQIQYVCSTIKKFHEQS